MSEYTYTNRNPKLKQIKPIDVIETNINVSLERLNKSLGEVETFVPQTEEIIYSLDVKDSVRNALDIVNHNGKFPLVEKDNSFITENVSLIYSTFVKNGGENNTWDAQVYSGNGFNIACRAETSVNLINQNVMFGLSVNPSLISNYEYIDCALYMNYGSLWKYEYGVGTDLGTNYIVNDWLSVEYDGNTTVYYKKNGHIIGTSIVEPNLTWYFDSSFYQLNSSLNKVSFYSLSSASNIGSVVLTEFLNKVRQIADDSANGARCTGCSTTCSKTCSLACSTECSATCTGDCYNSTCGAQCTVACAALCDASCGNGCIGVCGAGTCSGGCRFNCTGGACVLACTGSDGCGNSCQGICKGCIGPCASTCKASCANGCSGSCYSTCHTGCNSSCTATCATACGTGTCNSTCGSGCTFSCGATCQSASCGLNCTTNCYSNACTNSCSVNCSTACTTSCFNTCSNSCTAGCANSLRVDSDPSSL